MDLPRDAEIALARRLLLFVGLGYLLVQLLAFSFDRPPSWDEAIYLSQVTPGAEPLPFVPSRARGITFLALPIQQLGASLPTLRVVLAVATAAALTSAFRMWAPVLGVGAVAAAVLCAGAWPVLFYGSELMPNLWVALIAVAASAVLACRIARGEGRYDELVAGGLVALAALFRPLDAVVLAAALILAPIAMRRATVAWTVHLVLGLIAGWAPWLVEMIGRFGSPSEAFAAAARLGHTGRWSLPGNVQQYLALSDGPPIGPVADPDIPVSGLLWCLGVVALVTWGVRVSSERGLLSALVVPTAAGVALAAEYVVFTGAQAPRFLLPGLALLMIPAGLGLASIVTAFWTFEGAKPVSLAIAASTLVVAWAVAQVVIATRVEAGVTGQRVAAERGGLRIHEAAAGQPCHVYSEASFPIVGYAAGCRAAPLGKVLQVWPERADQLQRRGIRPFLVLHRSEEPRAPGGATLVAEVPSILGATWFIYGPG
jgi:hypothetical protein